MNFGPLSSRERSGNTGLLLSGLPLKEKRLLLSYWKIRVGTICHNILLQKIQAAHVQAIIMKCMQNGLASCICHHGKGNNNNAVYQVKYPMRYVLSEESGTGRGFFAYVPWGGRTRSPSPANTWLARTFSPPVTSHMCSIFDEKNSIRVFLCTLGLQRNVLSLSLEKKQVLTECV